MTDEPTYTVTFTDWEHAAILTLLENDSVSDESSGSHDAEMWPLLEKMRGAQPDETTFERGGWSFVARLLRRSGYATTLAKPDVEGEPAGTGGGSRSLESPSATPVELAARITKEVNDNGCLTDYGEVMLAQLQQQTETLTQALVEIASLPDQSEDWHEHDVAVQIARAALAAVPANQTHTP